MHTNYSTHIANRFRKLLPIVVDVETSGLNPQTHALLEIAAVTLTINPQGLWQTDETLAHHVMPFPGAQFDPKSLELTQIDPDHPFRFAISEHHALSQLYTQINQKVKAARCQRAILVAHNAWFDLLFIKAASERCGLKIPFHAFTTIDTASLSALAFGQTVLAKAMQKAGLAFDPQEAHSAIYDAQRTAELFCHIINHIKPLSNLLPPSS